MTTYRICLLPGDGIGPEITAEAVKVLGIIGERFGASFEFTEALLGGVAIDATGTDEVSAGYGGAYPVAIVCMVLFTTMLHSFFH